MRLARALYWCMPVAMSWALALGAEQMAPFDASGHTIALAQTPDSVTVDAAQGCVAAVERAISAYEGLRM